MKIIFTIFLTLFTTSALANTDSKLALPIDCALGQDCFIVNHVDTEKAADSFKDFTCAGLTTDGHEGTDFALRSRAEMKSGVDVLAAMDGKVSRIRNGDSDTVKTEEQIAAIKDTSRNCGNGILIDHGQGKNTFYCHMKKDSITVKPGDAVKEGQKIGQVGQSGDAQFPHLHFTYIWEDAYIDPFTGVNMGEGCGQAKQPLWKADIPYDPYPVFDAGFANKIPDFKTIEKDGPKPSNLSSSDNTLVYWIGFFHAQAGDNIEMKITQPDGEVLSWRKATFEKSRMLPSFYYTGRKLEGATLMPGTYKGETTLKRKGQLAKTLKHSITLN